MLPPLQFVTSSPSTTVKKRQATLLSAQAASNQSSSTLRLTSPLQSDRYDPQFRGSSHAASNRNLPNVLFSGRISKKAQEEQDQHYEEIEPIFTKKGGNVEQLLKQLKAEGTIKDVHQSEFRKKRLLIEGMTRYIQERVGPKAILAHLDGIGKLPPYSRKAQDDEAAKLFKQSISIAPNSDTLWEEFRKVYQQKHPNTEPNIDSESTPSEANAKE